MTCKNCGHTLNENYCEACGEKRFDHHQLSVKHFIEETFEGLVHFDNKYLRTLKVLFTKPGQLSLNYVEGKRASFVRPIQFFLITNLIFFIFISGNPYSLGLYNYVTYTPFINYNTRAVVADKMRELHVSQDTYAYIFNETIKSDSKELIFVFIPIYALIFCLLFIVYRRTFVEHLVFATHFTAFVLCWFFLSSWLISKPFYLITQINYSNAFDSISGLFTCLVISAYLAISARRFYGAKWYWSVFTGLLTGASFFYVIQVYRMLLFWKIVYM